MDIWAAFFILWIVLNIAENCLLNVGYKPKCALYTKKRKKVLSLLKRLFLFPSSNLTIAIPVVLILGFVLGLYTNTTFLKDYILLLTFMMIYPTMIGFKLKEAIDLAQHRIYRLTAKYLLRTHTCKSGINWWIHLILMFSLVFHT